MNSLKTYYLLVLTAALWSLLSCEKEAPYAEVGSTEVDISFQSPSNNSIVNVGDELHVEGIIKANAMMSGWKVEVTKTSSGESLISYQDLYEQTQYLFHYHWLVENTHLGNLTINVEAFDKEMNTLSSKSITIECQN